MIDRRRLFLSVLTPMLAGFVLVGSTLASPRKNERGATTAQSTNAAASSEKTTSSKKTEAKTEAPTHTTASSSEIANAKSKGLVWVNTESKVYHKNGRYYGNTKHGKFMTEADAQKAGYKAARR